MRTARALIICVFAGFGVSSGDAATLEFQSGYVRYEVDVKTLGIGGEEITAVNHGVIGRVHITNGEVRGGLIVPVVEFDSDNTKRDRDVAEILRYKEHPAITFEIVEVAAEDVERVLMADSGRVDVRARLTAAGGSKEYDTVLEFRREGPNTVRFTTRIDARFTDFGIEPPRFGLILKTAPDRIDLSGDLVFEIRDGGGSS